MSFVIARTQYDFSNRKKMRGAWFVMLANAYWSKSILESKYVCLQIRKLQEYFPCEQCKIHFGDHIAQFPPEFGLNSKLGVFNWIVNFMNEVNIRIGKPIYKSKLLIQQFRTNNFASSNSTYNFSDCSKLRGAWFVILSNSCYTADPITDKIFCKQLRVLQDCFPIDSDAEFFGDYLLQNPPEEQIGELMGMFIWTVNYMNAYRRYTGAQEYQRYILYKEFHEPGFNTCQECGDSAG